MSPCDPEKANIIGNPDFQFVEVPSAPPSLNAHEDDGTLDLATVRKPFRISWMTQDPTVFQPITNRSIYAFEVSPNQKPMLAAEYLADDKGRLLYVPGRKRRLREVKDAPKGEPREAASLPLVRQGECLRYAFVAIRGRLDRWAIGDMENGLEPIFRWLDLSDDSTFTMSGGKRCLSAVDPLTIALSLNAAYQEKLDKAVKYTVAYPENEDREAVLTRSLKFELARKIKDNLLTDAYGNRMDPQEIADHHLAKAKSGKLELDDYLDTELETLANLEAERNKAANKVILFLESGLWDKVQSWYLKTPVAELEIGHQCVGAELRTLSRLNETKPGKAYLQQLASDKDNNVLSYVFHPGEEKGEKWERYLHRCTIARKAITAVALSFMDTAPAIIVAYRDDLGRHLVQLTLDFQLGQERTLLAKVGRRGFVTRTLGYEESQNYVKLDPYKAKAKLDEWLGEERKAHWPKDSTPGQIAHLVTYLFAAVEAANAVNKILEMVKKFKKRPAEPGEQALATAEAVAAALDLVVALEDPVRELAHHLHAAHAVGAGAHAGGAAASGGAMAASQSQAKSLVEKLKGPPAFKLIGAAASAIDFVVYGFEARVASGKGEKGLAAGNALVSGGSLLMATGSAMNAFGMAQEIALLTAASTVVIVAAVVITLVGFIVINEFSKTAWQSFARYCCFGKDGQDGITRKPHQGHESWSGGDFSEWEPDVDGFTRQIEVFTGLLCAFQVSGDKDDEHRIMVTFGAIPPRGKLHVRFSITYETGEVKKPEYVVDFEKPRVALPGGDAKAGVEPDLTIQGTKVASLRLRATPLVKARVKDADCTVVLRYAPKAASQLASGTIPVEGDFKVELVTDGFIHADDVSSTDVEAEKRRPPSLPPAPRSWPPYSPQPNRPTGSSE